MRSEAEQQAIREDVFRWLDERLGAGAYEMHHTELKAYAFHGEQIPLLDTGRGIRNPASFSATLSLMTSAKRVEYNDEIRPDGLLRYSYRAGDSSDNIKLREAARRKVRLVYFKGVRPGVFVPYYPARIVADDPVDRAVYLAFDEMFDFFGDPLEMTGDERRYAERITKTRLHQPMFRASVMRAYDATCAVCDLKHAELLDAAHIVGDAEVDGFAHVTNGLALCKIHHASYDRNLLGITPEYEVRIDRELLNEVDGPMLRYGLQDMHGQHLTLPNRRSDWPSPERLASRFARFAA